MGSPTRTPNPDGGLLLRHSPAARADVWWAPPAATATAFLTLAAYFIWAALQSTGYYAAPYLSPLYSPCLAASCPHAPAVLVDGSWAFSPALLVVWIPAGLRITCYYYRKAYYRSLFLMPPACAIRGPWTAYRGEARFPLRLQSLHRAFFYVSLPVLAFLWWDVVAAFSFPEGVGIGLGSLVLLLNAVLLTLFALSCNSCRHLCGGHVKSLHTAPVRRRAWRLISLLNARHREYAWISLAWVALADAYVRLVAVGAFVDPRLL